VDLAIKQMFKGIILVENLCLFCVQTTEIGGTVLGNTGEKRPLFLLVMA